MHVTATGASPPAPDEVWSAGDYGLVATYANPPEAAALARFARVRPGETVLDVGTGTGVAALAARQRGARAFGVDPTPKLLAEARRNAALAGLDDVVWADGSAERLPFDDATFDVVLSQYGHMFSPDPEAATREMLRVLKPGGRLAFAAWTPDGLSGRLFALAGKYGPPPRGPPPTLWGDVPTVRERLRGVTRDLRVEHGFLTLPTLSPQHFRAFFEANFGPYVWLLKGLSGDAARLSAWRKEHDDLVASQFEEGVLRFEYLLARATKA